jgi:hypothetical protein
MVSESISLGEFIAEYRFPGEWEVHYTDATHLERDKYVKVGDIYFDCEEHLIEEYPVLPFKFRPVSSRDICESFSELPQGKKQAKRAERIIRDQLADCLVRTGLLRPELRLMQGDAVPRDFLETLTILSNQGYLILVVDTGALRRGAVSFLQRTLPGILIWTVVPVFVMTEVQREVADLSTLFRKIATGQKTAHPGKCDVLERRPQVSCVSRELNYLRRSGPVEWLTTFPEHLGESNGASRVDRLIIESVKDLKRDRGLHQGVYLVTGDKDMASLAALENVNTLYVGVPSLPDEVHSVRYDSFRGDFILTPVHYLLWDLAQVFSTIRAQRTGQEQRYELIYYSKTAREGFLAYDMMEIREY